MILRSALPGLVGGLMFAAAAAAQPARPIRGATR